MANILIVDDDELFGRVLSTKITRMGCHAHQCFTLKEALHASEADDYDVVFLDVVLPDGNGLEHIVNLKNMPNEPDVIIVTGLSDENGAELAIKSGAWSYIQKSAAVKELVLPLERLLQYREEKYRNKRSEAALKKSRIIGSSPEIKKCLEVVRIAAKSDIGVLITGQTGTGKELFARAIHENSPRAEGNFVVVDCAALPETLAESIILGHSKGAFTGAEKSSQGLVKQADGGTLFLDEVGELPLSLQKNFLRVLQEHCYRPVGSDREIESDFRVVAATNKNLNQMSEAGRFREDLLFRLQGFDLKLPPLKKRRKDLLRLAGYKIDTMCTDYGQERKIFADDFTTALLAYSWPGNVRELFQAMDRVFATAMYAKTLFEYHLPEYIRLRHAKEKLRAPGMREAADTNSGLQGFTQSGGKMPPWKVELEKHESEYFSHLMKLTAGNISAASKISGVSRPRLYQIIKKYRL